MNLKKQFIINLLLNNYLVYSLMIIFKYFYSWGLGFGYW